MNAKFLSETLQDTNILGDSGVFKSTAFQVYITNTGCEGADWIYLAHDRNQWRTLKHGNKQQNSVKGKICLDYLSNY